MSAPGHAGISTLVVQRHCATPLPTRTNQVRLTRIPAPILFAHPRHSKHPFRSDLQVDMTGLTKIAPWFLRTKSMHEHQFMKRMGFGTGRPKATRSCSDLDDEPRAQEPPLCQLLHIPTDASRIALWFHRLDHGADEIYHALRPRWTRHGFHVDQDGELLPPHFLPKVVSDFEHWCRQLSILGLRWSSLTCVQTESETTSF